MQTEYKGFRLDAKRQRCMAGYDLMYFSAVRIEDGFIFIEDYADTADTARTMIRVMKQRVDGALVDPKAEGLEPVQTPEMAAKEAEVAKRRARAAARRQRDVDAALGRRVREMGQPCVLIHHGDGWTYARGGFVNFTDLTGMRHGDSPEMVLREDQ